jgi:hypothetical protein
MGSPKRLNPARILSTAYEDQTTSARRQYEYRVTAVNSNGKESRFTAVVIETHVLVGDGSGKGIAANAD